MLEAYCFRFCTHWFHTIILIRICVRTQIASTFLCISRYRFSIYDVEVNTMFRVEILKIVAQMKLCHRIIWDEHLIFESRILWRTIEI